MRKIYLLSPVALFSAALFSCGGGDHIVPTPTPNPGPNPGPVVTDFYVSPTCNDCLVEINTEYCDGLEEVLGSGYDVTGDYMSAKSLRATVVDISKLSSDALTVFNAPASSTGELYSGIDAASFLSDLSANVGIGSDDSEPYFAGTLNSVSSQASYVYNIAWIRGQIGGFPATTSTVRRALSSGFILDLMALTPDDIVKKYGTHFVSHACVGLAVKTLYSAFVDARDSEKVSKAYKGLSAVESSLAGQLGPDLSLTLAGLDNYGATFTKTFCGGELSLLEYDKETGLLGDMTAWQESAAPSNYSLVSLSDGDLTPLTVAIDDMELRDEVEMAIWRYMQNANRSNVATVPLLQNSNGVLYRYVTSYEESEALENESGIKAFGVLGSLYKSRSGDAIPLYSFINSDGCQILSLIQPTDEWECIGYVLPSRTNSSVSLYDISDGTRYAYTIEAANSYGPRSEWHPTGAVFHLLRP